VSINRLVELLNAKEKCFIPKRPGEPDCTFADTKKIKKMLGWKASVSIEKGVELMLRDIHYWDDAPVWTPDLIQEATEDWFKYLGQS
jgi:UDP-glucose 4-epimerase